MKQYEIDYYEQFTGDKCYYCMEGIARDALDNKVRLNACIKPHDYDSAGFIEDDNGAYYDAELVEEACFNALKEEICQQAAARGVNPDELHFTKLRISRDDLCY